MSGSKIESLNEGVRRFIDQVSMDETAKRRVDIAIVTFNSTVQKLQDFLPVSQMTAPLLTASGSTAMGQGIKEAVRLIKERNHFYAMKGTPAHKPWVFMITDGTPELEPANHIEEAIDLVQREEQKGKLGKLKFWSLAVEGANKSILHQLSPRVFDMKNHEFIGIFDWLAESMSCISVSRPGSDPEYAPLPQNVVPSEW